jgi:hypothetical protein
MGEAQRKREIRADAFACGRPVPRPIHCPACGSKRIAYVPKGSIPSIVALAAATDKDLDVEYGACGKCRALWEAFPPLYIEDPVCAEPCDNCAFRPGSPEQQDPEKWKALIASLKPEQSLGHFTGKFFCHKGVPIDQATGPGNFLFPQKPVLMDGEPVHNPDGTVATIEDTLKMRTCSGFLRMFWTQAAKLETKAND